MTSDEAAQGAAVRGTLWVTWGQFQIVDAEDWPVGSHWSNGLISPEVSGAVIATGIHTGPVRLTVEVCDQPPGLETEPWEEVVECTVHAPAGRLHVVAEGGEPEVFPGLSPRGPGHSRVRCHARGRDIAFDLAVREPVEDYLLQVWPAPPGPETVHKQTDQRGRSLRRSAAAPPNPDIVRANQEATRRDPSGPIRPLVERDTEVVIPQPADPHALGFPPGHEGDDPEHRAGWPGRHGRRAWAVRRDGGQGDTADGPGAVS